ncbi:hypothetical protein ACROYT_G008403 [Oculina patagonica]
MDGWCSEEQESFIGGYIKYTVPLNITKYLAKEDEYVPWAALDDNVDSIASILPQSSPAYKYLKKYLQYQARTMYSKLGFRDGGDHLEVVPANFRSLVYFYGIKNGGVKEWNFAFEQLKKTTVASERTQLLYGLSGTSEPWILSRYLQYSTDPDKIKTQDTTSVLRNVANYSPIGRQLTWQFIKLNWDFILAKFGGGFFAMRRLILGVTSGFATEFELQDLKTFNKQHHAGSGARAQQQAEERVMANIQWRKDNEEDVANWLKDYLEANNIPLN